MVKPTIAELSQGNKYNRYMLVMMAAKGAKYIIDRENYTKEHPDDDHYAYEEKELDIDYNDKPVKNAVRLFHEGKMVMKLPEEAEKAIEDHAHYPMVDDTINGSTDDNHYNY